MPYPSTLRALLAASLLVAAVGCGSDPAGPVRAEPSAARAAAGGATERWTIEQFVAAQGTYCGIAGDFCHPTQDIGSILGWAGPTGAPAATLDFGGVNAAWYLENLGTDFGYAASGTVRERRLADGRRLVSVTMRFENTLLAVYPGPGTRTIVGADFTDYGTVEPVTASGTLMVQMALPADYVGLPDLLQVIFEPLPGMELLQLVANVRAEGALREDFDGIAAGTTVRVTLHVGYLPKLIGTPAEHGRGLVRTFFGPSDQVRIQPVGH